MSLTSKDIVPLTRARAKLTELVDEVHNEVAEKIITKNGESCAALIDAERLDHYHRLEREHIHLVLLDEVLRGLERIFARHNPSLRIDIVRANPNDSPKPRAAGLPPAAGEVSEAS